MRFKPARKYLYLWISIVFFLFAIGYKYFFITIENTPEKNAQLVSKKLEREIQSIEQTLTDISSIVKSEQTPSFNLLMKESEYPYYVFSNKRIFFWSYHVFVPNHRDILGEFDLAYVELAKGKYVARKESFRHDNRAYEVVFLVPLVEFPAVVNEYLKNTYNEKIFTDSNIEIIQSSVESDYHAISLNGRSLFSVKFGNIYTNSDLRSRLILIFLISISFLFAALFIKLQLNDYVRERAISQ